MYRYIEVGDIVKVPWIEQEFIVKAIDASGSNILGIASLTTPEDPGSRWKLTCPLDELRLIKKARNSGFDPDLTARALYLITDHSVRLDDMDKKDIFTLVKFLSKQGVGATLTFYGARYGDIGKALEYFRYYYKNEGVELSTHNISFGIKLRKDA
jgi:hypothetical protein